MSVHCGNADGRRPVKVLYLHHCGPFGGASRSLLEMVESFPAGRVVPYAATQEGQYADILRNEGISVIAALGISQFDNSRYSHYQGWRWLILLREFIYLPFTIAVLLRARWLWPDIDIVHVNEVTMIPSLLMARYLFRCPVFVHVRSVQRSGSSFRTRLVELLLRRCASHVVAIDNNVRRSLSACLPVKVIHNGLRFPDKLPAEKQLDSAKKADRGLSFTVAMVGTLSRVKGCIEFVQAAALCKKRGLNIRFIFVGKSARPAKGLKQMLLRLLGLSQEIEEELNALIASNELQEMVEFWPFTTNLDEVYRKINLLCFPSHYDAPGRPIFEAAFYGVPSIAAVTEPMEDTIINGVTGITIHPGQADQLATKIEWLYNNPEECIRMGEEARILATEGFDAQKNALIMFDCYQSALTARTQSERADAA